MIAVLATCVMGPFSSVYVLGWMAAPLLLSVGGMLGVTLGLGVQPGSFTLPDIITASITSALVFLYALLLLYMACWTKVEAFFSTTPWLRHNGRGQMSEGGRTYATRCPFTGHKPTMRCPSCEARVHDSAFHKADRLVSWPVGETVLRWDGAKLATEQTGNLKKARRQLDTFLDFRGNTLFGSVSGKLTGRLNAPTGLSLLSCCVGCATWQKCFNLLPRLSLSLALSALFFAFVPWGFANFLDEGSGGNSASSGVGAGAKALQIVAEVLAVLYAQAALLVQLQALLRANMFLAKYSSMVPSLQPMFRLPGWRLMRLLERAPWEQAL